MTIREGVGRIDHPSVRANPPPELTRSLPLAIPKKFARKGWSQLSRIHTTDVGGR
jgi:hypothetical protein